MGVWGPCPQWVQGKTPGGGSESEAPDAYDTFFENMLYRHGFKNDIAIFSFIAYTSVQYEMEENSVWRQKSGTTRNNACLLGTRSGQATARPAQTLAARRQCSRLSFLQLFSTCKHLLSHSLHRGDAVFLTRFCIAKCIWTTVSSHGESVLPSGASRHGIWCEEGHKTT